MNFFSRINTVLACCLKIKSVCVFSEHHLYSSFKPHTHKLYILRHCTTIVYI